VRTHWCSQAGASFHHQEATVKTWIQARPRVRRVHFIQASFRLQHFIQASFRLQLRWGWFVPGFLFTAWWHGITTGIHQHTGWSFNIAPACVQCPQGIGPCFIHPSIHIRTGFIWISFGAAGVITTERSGIACVWTMCCVAWMLGQAGRITLPTMGQCPPVWPGRAPRFCMAATHAAAAGFTHTATTHGSRAGQGSSTPPLARISRGSSTPPLAPAPPLARASPLAPASAAAAAHRPLPPVSKPWPKPVQPCLVRCVCAETSQKHQQRPAGPQWGVTSVHVRCPRSCTHQHTQPCALKLQLIQGRQKARHIKHTPAGLLAPRHSNSPVEAILLGSYHQVHHAGVHSFFHSGRA
jgi:hypothetical protein